MILALLLAIQARTSAAPAGTPPATSAQSAPAVPAPAVAAQSAPAHTVIDAPDGARQPQLAIAAGKFKSVYVVFGTKDSVQVARSANDGRTFGRPTPVGEGLGVLSLGLRRGPRIAALRKCLVVTAIAGAKGGGQDGDLWCWRSENDGKSWSKTGPVNPKPGSVREGLHAMAQGTGWNLFAAWIDLETDSPRIVGALSTDAGATWAKPVVLESDAGAICPCCAPSAAFAADGSVAVMWRNQSGGSRDMVVARSTDGGATFSKPAKLGTGTWKISACPMDGGGIVARGNELTAVWRREDKLYRSSLTGEETLVGEGEQAWPVAAPAGIYLLWVKKRGGPLLVSTPANAIPIEIDSAASDPSAVAATDESGLALAAWESGDPAHPKIVVARIDANAAPK